MVINPQGQPRVVCNDILVEFFNKPKRMAKVRFAPLDTSVIIIIVIANLCYTTS